MNREGAKMRRRYRDLLEEKEIKVPFSRAGFSRRLNEAFRTKLSLTSEEKLRLEPELVGRLFEWAKQGIKQINQNAVHRAIPSIIRKHIRNSRRALASIDSSLKHLERAETSLGDTVQELIEGFYNFEEPRGALLRLREAVADALYSFAELIPPERRTEAAKELAQKAVHHLKHPSFPRSNSARLQFELTQAVEQEARRITSNTRNLNRFISAFFEAGLDLKVDAANVKTMRTRMKQRSKQSKHCDHPPKQPQ